MTSSVKAERVLDLLHRCSPNLFQILSILLSLFINQPLEVFHNRCVVQMQGLERFERFCGDADIDGATDAFGVGEVVQSERAFAISESLEIG